MMGWIWFVDASLAVALVGVAVRAMAGRDLVETVALFIVFGILMTLVWVRLGAPDVVLAEAGIGTGFTGALVVAALVGLRRRVDHRESDEDETADDRSSD